MRIVKLFFELTKIKITFAVMLTTIVGYALAANSFDANMIVPVLGLFVLAMGSAVLNQYQEYELDSKMDRTKNRPIPSGRISPFNALLLSLIMIFIGSALLYFFSGFDALWLGLLALIWYNAIYTPMKRKTPFAVIPGSVIGALPPLVGWVAGGGELLDPRAMILAFFFFIWQVPHFWLLMIKYGEQYEEGGFPSLQRFYSERHIRWVTFLWTVSTAIAAMMLPAFKVIKSEITAIGIIAVSTWLIFSFIKLLKFDEKLEFKPMPYFMKINIFVLVMIILLSIDNFWGLQYLI
jgi:protoheme IX farnesyltransferase